jgi:hypothetical protein
MLILGVVATSTGCATTQGRLGMTRPNAESPPKNIQIIAERFNQNSRGIKSIKCDYVTVDGKVTDPNGGSTPYTLDAMLAFEKPGNFRMKGSFAGRPEVDLGANSNEIWFWVKRMEAGKVFYLRRNEIDRAQINMPFQPDWIAEVLGANEIDPREYEMENVTGDGYVIRTAAMTPYGRVVKRLMFDRRMKDRLRFIRVESMTGSPIAQAEIIEYWDDQESGLYCPRKVQMHWPEAGTKMTVSLRRHAIQFNAIESQWSQTLFARDGLADKEPINLASIRPPADAVRTSTHYGPRENPVAPASAIQLGMPKPYTPRPK